MPTKKNKREKAKKLGLIGQILFKNYRKRTEPLKGVFAKNEKGYWLNAIKKRF